MEFFFPHQEYRKIQGAFMNQVYTTLQNKGQLLVHAPTGIGKTASALSPALTYVLKENKTKTIFFLTSRNTQHLIAIETLKKVKKKFNLDLIAVDIIGKKNMCNQPGVQTLRSGEFIEFCKDLREKGQCQYYENLKLKGKTSPEAANVIKKLKEESPMHVEEMNSINFSSDLCSYEMAGLLGKEAQVVIADYNYIINPHIRDSLLKRMNKSLGDCIVIFDEGHNVPSRARDLLTATTTSFIIEAAAKETKSLGYTEMATNILEIKEALERLAKKIPFDKQEIILKKEDFIKEIENIGNYEEIMGNCVFIADQILQTKKRSFTQSIAQFMESWLGPEQGFVRILGKNSSKMGKEIINVSYRCLDPSIGLKGLIQEVHAFVLMSGTLTPIEMYADLLGVDQEKAITVEYQNQFPKENRLNIIVPETSTKYQSRSAMMWETIAKKCADITTNIPGNSIIFFPSYNVLENVYDFLREKSTKTIFIEDPELSKEQRGDLLERFKDYKETGAILIAVAGGSFAEGVDLPGDLLKGVIVVGLPLARPDLETQELINYYDKRFSKGWDYGYTIPAIIKTLQSAGRCIRSETDRGIVIYMDERYIWQNYKKCFSPDMHMKIEKDPIPLIKEFFKQ